MCELQCPGKKEIDGSLLGESISHSNINFPKNKVLAASHRFFLGYNVLSLNSKYFLIYINPSLGYFKVYFEGFQTFEAFPIILLV